MKKLVIALVLVFVLVSCSTMPAIRSEPAKSESGSYTYVSVMDPIEILSWTVVDCVQLDFRFAEVTYVNPDSKSKFTHAFVLFNVLSNTVSGYSYVRGCEIYVFAFNSDTNSYDRTELNEEWTEFWKNRYKEAFGLDWAC